MRLKVSEIYPVPPPPLLDEKNLDSLKENLILYAESLNNYSAYLRNYYFHNYTINADSLNVKIGINDTLHTINPHHISNMYSNNEYLKENPEFRKLLVSNTQNLKSPKTIDINRIKEHKPFKIAKTSELGWKQELRNDYQNNKDFYLSGILDLSRVYFNKEKNKGYFTCSEIANHYEIFTQLILVEKINGKWKIKSEFYSY
ncbi:hypothetical protein [Pseudozobellia thermophila]|nr:hypothetical protein [Pseudozobellia thermophila]